MIRLPRSVALVFLCGCAGGTVSAPTPRAAPASAESSPAVTADLDTSRAWVVRVGRSTVVDSGQIQVSSPVAGVLVGLDDREGLALPLDAPVSLGAHIVTAQCPDGTVETYYPVVEAGAPATLRVCSSLEDAD